MPRIPGLEVLAQRRQAVFSRLGAYDETHVVSRVMPGRAAWPNSVLGRMAIVRRAHDVLLFTDGLSEPYDPELWPTPPAVPLDYELCFSIGEKDPAFASNEALASSVWPQLLYAVADVSSADWVDVRGLLSKFTAITLQGIIGTGFGHGLERGGAVAFLAGMPLDGGDFDRQLYLNGYYAGLPVEYSGGACGLFPLKVLTPSELDWAVANGNDGGKRLADAFLAAGHGSTNWLGRPSVR